MNPPLPLPSSPDVPNPAEQGETFASLTRHISHIPLDRPQKRFWWIGFLAAFGGLLLLLASIGWLFLRGVGIWGINLPVAWGFAIVNFVWWIGIGHAGTFISAFLLLLRQNWRTSINRFAAAIFPSQWLSYVSGD